MFLLQVRDKMAECMEHFAMPGDSLEGHENNVPEGGSPKTEDSQIPQIDFA